MSLSSLLVTRMVPVAANAGSVMAAPAVAIAPIKHHFKMARFMSLVLSVIVLPGPLWSFRPPAPGKSIDRRSKHKWVPSPRAQRRIGSRMLAYSVGLSWVMLVTASVVRSSIGMGRSRRGTLGLVLL